MALIAYLLSKLAQR